MTTAQGFTPDDRLFCIEHLTPEARERLGIFQTRTGGPLPPAWCNGPRIDKNFTYADDAAILAEVEGELRTMHLNPLCGSEDDDERYWGWRFDWTNEIVEKSRFTAAAAAFRQCKGESA